MREFTACGSCEFVWLDSFDSFIVTAAGDDDATADKDPPADDDDKGTGCGYGNGNGNGNVTGAAAAHVCPKYKKAILAVADNQVAVYFYSSLLTLPTGIRLRFVYGFVGCCSLLHLA